MFNGICLCMYICSLTYLHFYIVSLTCLLYLLLFENISRCQSIYYELKTCICLKQIQLLFCIVLYMKAHSFMEVKMWTTRIDFHNNILNNCSGDRAV